MRELSFHCSQTTRFLRHICVCFMVCVCASTTVCAGDKERERAWMKYAHAYESEREAPGEAYSGNRSRTRGGRKIRNQRGAGGPTVQLHHSTWTSNFRRHWIIWSKKFLGAFAFNTRKNEIIHSPFYPMDKESRKEAVCIKKMKQRGIWIRSRKRRHKRKLQKPPRWPA